MERGSYYRRFRSSHGSIAALKDPTGPTRVTRFNLFPAAELQVSLARGFSSGQGIAAVEAATEARLPHSFEWTEIALQEKLAGNPALIALGLAVLFVFLLLAALSKSWQLPAAVIPTLPMCILAAMIDVSYRDLDRNILVDIGLIVRIGGEERHSDRGVR